MKGFTRLGLKQRHKVTQKWAIMSTVSELFSNQQKRVGAASLLCSVSFPLNLFFSKHKGNVESKNYIVSRSMYQYSNMAQRLSGQTFILYLVLFPLCPSDFWEVKDKRNLKTLQFFPGSLGAMLEY